MSEQGLKTIIYPELDEAGFQEFIQKFTEHMSNASVNVGVSSSGPSSSSSSSGSSGGGSSGSSSGGTGGLSKQDMKEVITDGNKDSDKENSENPVIQEKKSAKVTESLGSVLGKVGLIGSAVGVGATTVAGSTVGIFKFLENASPPLRTVMDLFSTAFNMIWMPIGNILARELMPFLTKTFARVAEFVSEAMTIYENEGWVGLIHNAITTTFDVLFDLLLTPELWIVMGTIVWELLTRLSLGNIFSMLIFGEPASWTDIRNIINGLKGIWDWYVSVWEWIYNAFTTVWGWVGDVFEWILDGIVNNIIEVVKFVSPIFKFFDGLTLDNFLDKFIQYLKDMLKGLFNLGGSIVSTITGSESSGNVIVDVGKGLWNSTIGSITGLKLAEGGIVTQPTYGLFGEAGPEAVIPLNQLSQVANDYRTIENANVGGNNVMNFYISGNNATEVGEEVQRVLEKTVGKASSKLMWW